MSVFGSLQWEGELCSRSVASKCSGSGSATGRISPVVPTFILDEVRSWFLTLHAHAVVPLRSLTSDRARSGKLDFWLASLLELRFDLLGVVSGRLQLLTRRVVHDIRPLCLVASAPGRSVLS